MSPLLFLVKSYEGMEMWVDTFLPLSRGFVFNGVNGVLRIKNTGRRTRERISKGYVCVCVELDAVIDYGPLSLTGRHMETVTVFRYRHQYLLPPSFLPTFPPPFRKLFPKLFLSFICCYKFVIYEYSIIRWRDLFSNSASRDRWARENKVLL